MEFKNVSGRRPGASKETISETSRKKETNQVIILYYIAGEWEKYDGDIFLRRAVVSLVSGTGAYGDRIGGKREKAQRLAAQICLDTVCREGDISPGIVREYFQDAIK
ncbi:hypothetical protein DXB96_02115 [Clostridium sp. OM07-10AC]|nr:hypothetical protein DXB96_02115 [Clostridium sp. OM07-10AC]